MSIIPYIIDLIKKIFYPGIKTRLPTHQSRMETSNGAVSKSTFDFNILETPSPNSIDNVCHPKSLIDHLQDKTSSVDHIVFHLMGVWFYQTKVLTFRVKGNDVYSDHV